MKEPTAAEEAQASQNLALLLAAYLQYHHAQLAKKVRHILWWRGLLGGTALALLILAVWVAGNIFGVRYDLRSSVFPARSSDTRISRIMQDQAQTYRLQFIQPNGKRQSYSLQDMGLQIDVDASLSQARQQ